MNKPGARSILTIVSVIGVGVTAVLAAVGGMKSKDVIDNAEAGIEKSEIKKKVAIRMAPAAVAGIATAGTIIASHRLGTKEIVGLTATVGYLFKNRDYYERKMEEMLGKDIVNGVKQKFVDEYHKEIEEGLSKKEKFPAEETGKGNLLCYEAHFGRWFRSNKRDVDEAIRAFKLRAEGDEENEREPMAYNDLYNLLGIAESHVGNLYGWPASEDFREPEIKFMLTRVDTFKNIEEPVYIIELEPNSYPMDYWMEV